MALQLFISMWSVTDGARTIAVFHPAHAMTESGMFSNPAPSS